MPLRQKYPMLNLQVPKCPSAKKSLWRKVHNLHGDEMPHAEMFLWWNVRAKISLSEMSGSMTTCSLQFNLSLWLRSWKPFIACQGSFTSMSMELKYPHAKMFLWWNVCAEMSNFAMGTILGKGYPQAQVQTVHSTSAENLSKKLETVCRVSRIIQTNQKWWKICAEMSGYEITYSTYPYD